MKNTELQKLWPRPPEGALQHSTYLFNGKKLSHFLSYKKARSSFQRERNPFTSNLCTVMIENYLIKKKDINNFAILYKYSKKGGFEWLSTSIKSLVESVQITGFSPCKKKIHFFKRKANHVKVTTNRCVSNRKIRKEGFGLPSGIAGIAHSFSASSSSVSLVWDVSSVKAPLECPLQVFFFILFVSWGLGEWTLAGGRWEQAVGLVCCSWLGWNHNLIIKCITEG